MVNPQADPGEEIQGQVDLSSLGSITGLQFTLSASDNGEYGMNTPAYFAIDTLLRGEPQG